MTQLRSKAFLSLFVALVWVGSSPSPICADIIYDLSPVTLSNGFAISGGTITTDGTLGNNLEKTSILDYELNITGPFDFTFRPTNAGARVFNLDPEVVFTESEIYVPAVSTGTAELRFESREHLDFEATFFNQQLVWSQGGSPQQRSLVGFVSVSFGSGQNHSHNGQGTNSQPMLDRLVVATSSSVPEPGSMVAFSVLAVMAYCCRRRNPIGNL